MRSIKFILSGIALTLSSLVFSQKIMPVEGDLSLIKNEKTFNLVYDYSSMEVGDYSNEADYKNKKIKELNEKEKGTGDKWSESWERDKSVRYPEKFEELLNKGMAAKGATYKQNETSAKYTLIVRTTFIEPGFNVGVMKKPAAVSFEYIYVETANMDKVVARFTQKFVPGAQAMGFDYDTGTRIAESYAKAGKMFAAYIVKATK